MRVIEGRKRPQRILAPPKSVRKHPWALHPPLHASLFIDAALADELDASAKESRARGTEALGLLLGDALSAPGSGARYTVALSRATSQVQATSTHVRFDPAGFEAIARSLEAQAFDYLIVGWYHTHLGLGCFMSETDVRTQGRYFGLPHQFALVIDPIRQEAAVFSRSADTGKGLPFAVFENGRAGNSDFRKPR